MTTEALKIARLEARTQLQSQVIGLVNDPIVSSIGGFCIVHKLEKEKLIGPLAADALYLGIIAINTARTPALVDLAGKGLGLAGAALAGAGAGAAVGKLLPAAAGAGAAGAAAKAAKLLPAAGTGGKLFYAPAPMQLITKEEVLKRKDLPLWKRFLGMK